MKHFLKDMNAARLAHLDTDRDTGQPTREREAAIIDNLEGNGLWDVFRDAHPKTRAWSRVPPGALAEKAMQHAELTWSWRRLK